ncbi:MAG: hydantoinase/oxoprolinase family protein, partial [Rhodospirillales bacterium]|nr:hydantoinase/oxoprolinase family protein [Rhodospirillales bacterium]
DLPAPRARHEQRRSVLEQVVEIGLGGAAQFQQVAEAAGRDEARAAALLLQQGVGDHGRCMRHQRHGGRFDGAAGEGRVHAGQHAIRQVPRRAGHFRYGQPSTFLLDEGDVVTPLAEDEIPALVAAIRDAKLEAVAVSLLFSFLNDDHERRLGAALRAALPDVPVFLSCEVLPEIREFERASTTSVCAYVAPLLRSYLAQLEAATAAIGLPKLHVMGSNGGILDVAECLRIPAAVVESGPAAGVVAAALAGRQIGLPNLISFDMGGTTAKASVIADGEIAVTADYEVGGAGNAKRWMHGTGHPIRVPVVDLAEVSAGGGSIAWIDAGGALKVGPHSAGADPGPACYGRGGTRPTVTDANAVLGYLDPDAPLGGDLRIDRAAAEAAIARHVADPLGLSPLAAAARIVEVVNANMVEALRIVSIERGLDPAEFHLIAFGGAGPMHAAFLAAELGIPGVVLPPAPGAFSALGLVASDLRRDYSRTFYADLGSLDPAALDATIVAMEDDGRAMLEATGIAPDRQVLQRAADLRYPRQAYELTVPMDAGPVTRESLDRLMQAFHQKHAQTYGHANPQERVQMVNLRLGATGRLPPVRLAQPPAAARGPARTRPAWFPETGLTPAIVLRRETLQPHQRIAGPAIIDALDCTAILPPGWTGEVDPHGFVHLKPGARAAGRREHGTAAHTVGERTP